MSLSACPISASGHAHDAARRPCNAAFAARGAVAERDDLGHVPVFLRTYSLTRCRQSWQMLRCRIIRHLVCGLGSHENRSNSRLYLDRGRVAKRQKQNSPPSIPKPPEPSRAHGMGRCRAHSCRHPQTDQEVGSRIPGRDQTFVSYSAIGTPSTRSRVTVAPLQSKSRKAGGRYPRHSRMTGAGFPSGRGGFRQRDAGSRESGSRHFRSCTGGKRYNGA